MLFDVAVYLMLQNTTITIRLLFYTLLMYTIKPKTPADMITAEKKLLDRNEKIHKLFRQLSGQRDDYENKLQDLQQVPRGY